MKYSNIEILNLFKTDPLYFNKVFLEYINKGRIRSFFIKKKINNLQDLILLENNLILAFSVIHFKQISKELIWETFNTDINLIITEIEKNLNCSLILKSTTKFNILNYYSNSEKNFSIDLESIDINLLENIPESFFILVVNIEHLDNTRNLDLCKKKIVEIFTNNSSIYENILDFEPFKKEKFFKLVEILLKNRNETKFLFDKNLPYLYIYKNNIHIKKNIINLFTDIFTNLHIKNYKLIDLHYKNNYAYSFEKNLKKTDLQILEELIKTLIKKNNWYVYNENIYIFNKTSNKTLILLDSFKKIITKNLLEIYGHLGKKLLLKEYNNLEKLLNISKFLDNCQINYNFFELKDNHYFNSLTGEYININELPSETFCNKYINLTVNEAKYFPLTETFKILENLNIVYNTKDILLYREIKNYIKLYDTLNLNNFIEIIKIVEDFRREDSHFISEFLKNQEGNILDLVILRKMHFLICLGKLIVEDFKYKGDHLFLFGLSNTGKSFLIETFFKEMFGVQNLGVINLDETFGLSGSINKKIIIVSEYNHYKKNQRELFLKLVDGSLLMVNRKFKENLFLTFEDKIFCVLTNQNPFEYKDTALLNRFNLFNLNKTFEELNINISILKQEFFGLLNLSVQTYLKYKKQLKYIKIGKKPNIFNMYKDIFSERTLYTDKLFPKKKGFFSPSEIKNTSIYNEEISLIDEWKKKQLKQKKKKKNNIENIVIDITAFNQNSIIETSKNDTKSETWKKFLELKERDLILRESLNLKRNENNNQFENKYISIIQNKLFNYNLEYLTMDDLLEIRDAIEGICKNNYRTTISSAISKLIDYDGLYSKVKYNVEEYRQLWDDNPPFEYKFRRE